MAEVISSLKRASGVRQRPPPITHTSWHGELNRQKGKWDVTERNAQRGRRKKGERQG